MCPFEYTAVTGSGKVAPVNQVNHTSWVGLVTPTDPPHSVRNRCVIELFCGVVCVVTWPFWHFCWCRGFCHRTESDIFLFLLISTLIPGCSVERCHKVPRVRVFKVSLFISLAFWLNWVINSFLLWHILPIYTRASIWLQMYWIANIRSPRILLNPLRLRPVSSLHIPDVFL